MIQFYSNTSHQEGRAKMPAVLFMTMIIILQLQVHSCASMSTSPSSSPTYYNYFAFGSNMASSTMTALRNVRPVASSAAILPNHSLRFNIPGTRFVEPSWASVEPIFEKENLFNEEKVGMNEVHGVLYKLTEEDFETVCSTEGVPFGYTLHRCRVVPYRGNGRSAGREALHKLGLVSREEDDINETSLPMSTKQSLQALPRDKSIFAYTLRASRPAWRNQKIEEDVAPSQAYLNVLLRGGEEFGLDESYMDYLKRIAPGRTLFGDGVAELMLEAAEKRTPK